MSRVFVTGDCHGDYSRFSTRCFPVQKELTKDDFVIVTGDFGYWDNSNEQRYWRKWLSKKNFTILFCDGNHENFDMLKALPVSKWHGGRVHKISDNIIHLMRGQVYNINNKKWFVMGGANSHDISDGILELDDPNFRSKYAALKKRDAAFRINHLSWWKDELPNKRERTNAIKKLQKYNYKVDYIITHEAPYDVVYKLYTIHNMVCDEDEYSKWLQDEIMNKTEFTKWFCGHHHEEFEYGDVVMQYYNITEVK